MNMDKTYWKNQGRHQTLLDKLNTLVPFEGSVPHPKTKNKNLERFRKAANAYYDIFNNGGCNKGRSIRAIFKINLRNWRWGRTLDWESIFKLVEPKMDEIVLAAAAEQFPEKNGAPKPEEKVETVVLKMKATATETQGAITEKTRQWLSGSDVEPDPTCFHVGSSYVQNIRCSCGARFVTDFAAMMHALHCNGEMRYQQPDGTW